MIRLTTWASASLASYVLLAGSAQAATPFESCPATAFLVQDTTAKLYGVDVSTGYVEELAGNLGTPNKVNGMGFNLNDGFLYGWSYQHKTVARIGADYVVEPIDLVNPINDNYFIGDVTVSGDAYYMLKRGSGGSHGLWRVSLDADSGSYLDPQRISNGNGYSSFYDFAFHPNNGMLYTVTRSGALKQIDPSDGFEQTIRNIGVNGTFGAVYFDVDGGFYISRNSDGSIFKIDDVTNSYGEYAVWYSQGPKSGNNDGARCALAPVLPTVQSTIDFGDAPDSYGTSFDANGARHNLEGSTVYLGSSVDAEVQAWLSPDSSDDEIGDSDEDGVVFITDIAANETALVALESTGSGFINGWVDFDRNGTFDSDEQVVNNHQVSGGSVIKAFDVPSDVVSGPSWSRFRISTVKNLAPTGGVADGEVEDHPVELFGRRVTTTHYPGANDFVTLAYEDLWPSVGDYDMNDLVLYYRTSLNSFSMDNVPGVSSIYSISITGEIRAVGASFDSGFGIEIPGIPRSSILQSEMRLEIDGQQVTDAILEEGAGYENAVFTIYANAKDHVTSPEDCKFFRTEDFCSGVSAQSRFTLTVPVKEGLSPDVIDDMIFNPFIFGTNARRLEVHLKGRPPTIKADLSALGTGDDASDPANGVYYQTSTGLPWAMVVGTTWEHPEEARDILEAYPAFADYVISGGALNTDWYSLDNAVYDRLYQEQ